MSWIVHGFSAVEQNVIAAPNAKNRSRIPWVLQKAKVLEEPGTAARGAWLLQLSENPGIKDAVLCCCKQCLDRQRRKWPVVVGGKVCSAPLPPSPWYTTELQFPQCIWPGALRAFDLHCVIFKRSCHSNLLFSFIWVEASCPQREQPPSLVCMAVTFIKARTSPISQQSLKYSIFRCFCT